MDDCVGSEIEVGCERLTDRKHGRPAASTAALDVKPRLIAAGAAGAAAKRVRQAVDGMNARHTTSADSGAAGEITESEALNRKRWIGSRLGTRAWGPDKLTGGEIDTC